MTYGGFKNTYIIAYCSTCGKYLIEEQIRTSEDNRHFCLKCGKRVRDKPREARRRYDHRRRMEAKSAWL